MTSATSATRLATAFFLGLVANANAAFTTVINLPPDAAPAAIGSDTQLNVSAGGVLPSSFTQRFQAGAPDGTSTNVEVNISGGEVGSNFTANAGSTINFTGGEVGRDFVARGGSQIFVSGNVSADGIQVINGSSIEVGGGEFGAGLGVDSGSDATITGGRFDFLGASGVGSVVRMSGGVVDLNATVDSGGQLVVSGDALIRDASVFGASMLINGGEVNGVEVDIDGTVDLLSGTLGRLGFQQGVFTMSGGTLDGPSIISGSTALISGGTVGDEFRAVFGAEVKLLGSNFLLDGLPIAGLTSPGQSLVLGARGGAMLTGTLADGSPINLTLNETMIAGQDEFSADSTLRLTLVPEPTSAWLLMAALLAGFRSRNR